MFSAFLAVCQIAVDVVSSSPILAQRDFEEWKEFYQLLNISVGCNLTPKDIEERLSCYSNEVVYGTVGSFASDLLRQTFLMENVRGERMCETVIVDEVDCMLLDQGVHSTYLSHAVPGMHHIEPILFMIWKHITKHQKIVTENSKHFFLGVLDSIQVVLSSYVDISKLSNEREIPPEFQWLYLFEREKIFDADFTNKVYNGNDDEFKDSFTIEKILECLKFVETIWQIQFQPYIILNDTTVREVPWKSSSDSPNGQQIHLLVVGEGLVCVIHPYYNEPEIHNFVKSEIENCITFGTSELKKQQIPAYLGDFFANRIISWIENAFIANDMENGREYLVKDNDVVPVDFESTGVVQLDTKWGDCLHQFLEIKHGKKLSQITLITNFMSNQEYFCRYKGKIFGVSGTLGTEREKSFLMRQFSLSCLQIPTHRSNDFKELPGIICSAKDEWISTIQTIVSEQVEKYSNKGQRAVLVICEDINTAKELKTILTQVCASVVLYSRNDEKNDNIEGKLKAGSVIVATNIAGRGTDIDIEESVEKAGGLFVLVTFLPQNTRIENQVFGRSARKGQPGSAQIVLNNQCLPLCFSRHEYTDTASLKNLRDEMEKQRIVNIEEHAFKEVQLKEELFKQYCSFILDIKDDHQFTDVDKKIMLDSLHEHWGMWLKMNCENLADCGQQNKFKQSLAFTLKTAKTKLIERTSPCSNMSHIIKFANEQLLDKNYDLSLELFTRAIVINKEWAAIAYYNRAYCSLLKREKCYIDKAIDDLSKSQDCFRLFKEEAVFCLALSSTIKDEISYEQCVNSDTSEHQENVTTSQFSSRCHIINYFEENIKVALQQLQEFQKAKKDATAEVSSIFTIALGDENTSKKVESEIYLFWEMGLTEVIFVKERNPFCWKGMLVIALGVLQIAVAAVIIASTTVILTQLGWGLITEGVNDICKGANAVWNRDQEFIKSWMIGKAVSIAISVASFGYSQVCNAAKGAEGVKSTISAIKENCKAGAEKAVSELKAMGSKVTSKSFAPALKTTCLEVGKNVGIQFAKRGGKYLLEVAQEKVVTFFEDIAKKNIAEEIQLAFSAPNGKMHPMINDFIYLHLKENTPNNQICAKYMKITEKLLCSGNICQFRQVLMGCVKDVITKTSNQMQSEQNEIYQQCKPIFGIINGISCASYDVKNLVKIYCKHVKTALIEIYKDLLNNQERKENEDEDPTLCIIKKQIMDKTIEFLFRLLKESFQFTGTGLLANKLQAEVEKLVDEYGGKNNFGKGTIEKILAISSKVGPIGKELATKGNTDVQTIIETGVDAVETCVNLVADDGVKRTVNATFNAAKQGVTALKSGKTEDIFNAITTIKSDGIDTFADDDVKQTAHFTLNAFQQGVKAFTSGKTEDVFNAFINITADGIDKFADDDDKETTHFALNAFKQGVKGFKSGKTEDVFNAVTNITANGIDEFADDEVKHTAHFALNATEQGVKAFESGKTEDIFNAVTNITADGINKFAGDNMRQTAHFAIDATEQGIEAFEYGKTEEMFKAVTNITADGINTFAGNNVKQTAHVALDATKQGVF